MNAECFIGTKRRLGATARNAHVRRAAILAAAFAAFSLGIIDRAAAQEQPPGCDFAGVGANVQRSPTGKVYPGENVCYSFRYDNGVPGTNCDLIDLDAIFKLPNGTTFTLLIDANINSGDTLLCPSDLQCNPALSAADYCYVVSLADDLNGSSGCPPAGGHAPVDAPPGPPEIGSVVAHTAGDATSLTDPPDTPEACAPNNIPVARCGDGVTDTGKCLNSSPRVDCVNGSCAAASPPGTTCVGAETCDFTSLGTGIVCFTDFEADADLCRAPGTADQCTCCGDTLIQTGETCDRTASASGTACNTDGCRTNCTCCGDGAINGTPAELCDGAARGSRPGDGPVVCSTVGGVTCRTDCTCCGDGVINGGEFCDGPTNGTAGFVIACRADCTACGDGIINGPAGEEDCEPPGTATCLSDCTLPCSVLVEKFVARDNNCNGIQDAGDGDFEVAETQLSDKCLVYKICVTNTGLDVLNSSGVDLSDTFLGTATLDFGQIAAGAAAVCKIIPGAGATAIPAATCGTDGCLCTEVKGTNTASVITNGATCSGSGRDACNLTTSPTSVCSDSTPVDCCDVRVDKQISCSATGPFLDLGLVKNNEGGSQGPGIGAELPCLVTGPVFVRYQAKNVGDVNVTGCTLGESNLTFEADGTITSGVTILPGAFWPGGALDFALPTTAPPTCAVADAPGNEPNTANLSCACAVPADSAPLPVGAEDKADLNCSTPECSIDIQKTVAPDVNCNKIEDILECTAAGVPFACCTGLGAGCGFDERVEVENTECVVYRICVTNTGPQLIENVLVSDSHLGISEANGNLLDFGDLDPDPDGTAPFVGETQCRFVPVDLSGELDNCVGIDGACVCQDVEGQNTATVVTAASATGVLRAQCADSDDSACDLALHPDSNCTDTSSVRCFGGCRITAGRTNRLNRIENGLDLACSGESDTCRGQGGGQVGAPCGCSGCFTEPDPDAELAFELIQGNWQYDRKDPNRDAPGWDGFKIGTFHAKEFNSLICGCDEVDDNACNCTFGPECPIGGSDGFKDGKLCGNRFVGPEPRPAPANEICFSGKGQWTPSNGRKDFTVAFRVEAEDRSEPSVGKNSDGTCDVHRIRIWIPVCEGGTQDGKPCGPSNPCPGGACEDVNQLAHLSCCRQALGEFNPIGPVDDGTLRAPDIDDGGVLEHGNIQIHPQTPNTNRGRCPVPLETGCQLPFPPE